MESGERDELLNKKYEIVATTMIHKDVGTYTCYGIRFGVDIISDISMDKVKVELLVERMNANELSPQTVISFHVIRV